MRLKLGKLSFLALALVAGGLAAPAYAGGPYHDRIYADSFGNLVIHSRNGYKRIVVGAGHLAGELTSYEQVGGGGDNVVYLDEEDTGSVTRDCWKPPVLLKGRSYMYGLEDGELPDLPGGCHSESRAAPGAALRRQAQP
jgi:hypothetical protein